jgi:putative PIN family toxin of toxin-antitoxin system
VLDTNVVLSALLWRGTPYQLLGALRQSYQTSQLYSSLPLLEELADVLSRAQFARRLAVIGTTAQQLLADYASVVEIVEPESIAPVSSDPDDDMVLATAHAAHAEVIVSGDTDLLDLKEYRGIRIITAADAVRVVTESS